MIEFWYNPDRWHMIAWRDPLRNQFIVLNKLKPSQSLRRARSLSYPPVQTYVYASGENISRTLRILSSPSRDLAPRGGVDRYEQWASGP